MKDKYGLNTAVITGAIDGRTTINGFQATLNNVLTCFSPVSKEYDVLMSNRRNEIDILIATDCISEGQNLQDCDYLVNYDIHWNPVRIIQRFGRIDRIGSRNKVIQLVNFWPDITLDDYINLKSRVETRIKITVMTSTGDDDLINPEEKGDLEYRKAQLKRLQEEVVDIEDMSDGISIMDLGLNEFRLDLLEYMKEAIDDNRIWFGSDGTGVPRIKKFLTEGKQGLTPETILLADAVGTNDSAKRELVSLFEGVAIFETPKPVSLVAHLINICNGTKDATCLDFFSGTATTAHAVMQLNAKDSGKRKFIMVQLPEKCDETSEAYRAGYKNICEIGKERIRRAAKKIAEKHPDAEFDGGFRVLKLDETNMKDVYYAPADYEQNVLDLLESNIKEDRTDLDLLFGCLLEWGLPLSMSYQSENVDGCTVHNYNNGDLIACFNENIPDSVIKTIAKRQPLRAVFRDSSFAGSPAKINVTQIFKELAPDTSVKVL